MTRRKFWRRAGRLSLFLLLTGCPPAETRTGSRYLIPKGYVGWVRLDFSVANAEPARLQDGLYEFRFPREGRLQTSSRMEFGWAKDQYFYYSGSELSQIRQTGWGEGGSIWGSVNSGDGSQMFFVGTEEQYQTWVKAGNEPRAGQVESIRETGSLVTLPTP
jgi:Family of unknown function (DUF6843)